MTGLLWKDMTLEQPYRRSAEREVWERVQDFVPTPSWNRREGGRAPALKEWHSPWECDIISSLNTLAKCPQVQWWFWGWPHKRGQWPTSWKLPLFPRNIWNNPPTHQPMKLPGPRELTTPIFGGLLSSEMAHTLSLNTSTSYPSLYLSLISFCAET